MDSLSVLSAYDEKLIKEVAYQDESEVDKILENLSGLFKETARDFPLHLRLQCLETFLGKLSAEKKEIVQLASLEGGKPLKDSIVEMERALDSVKVGIAYLRTYKDDVIPMGQTKATAHRISFEHRVPKGVVFAISAFNHPINLAIHQIIPGLAAGCPVLFKPSLKTPLTGLKITELLYQSGVPLNFLQTIICKDSITEKFIGDKRISHVNFIGSQEVGWKLRSQLAPGTDITLEHGGTAPVIISESANVDSLIPDLLKSSFYHAGQVCVSTQNIFIHSSKEEEFVSKFKAKMEELVVGDPLSDKTDIGPLVTHIAADKVEKTIMEAIGKGAELLIGGKRISRTCITPCLLKNPSKDCEVFTKEVFGPVVSLIPFNQMSEVEESLKDTEFAFQAAIYTKDIDEGLSLVSRIPAKTLMINDHSAFRADWMPFGGIRKSGKGLAGIPYAIDELTVKKLVVLKSAQL